MAWDGAMGKGISGDDQQRSRSANHQGGIDAAIKSGEDRVMPLRQGEEIEVGVWVYGRLSICSMNSTCGNARPLRRGSKPWRPG
jgi:hypothetical protein